MMGRGRSLRSVVRFGGVVMTIVALGAGCRRPQARVVPEMPVLDVPRPPAHDPELVDAQVATPVPLVEAPARVVPERPRVAPPPREATRGEPPKADPPPAPAKPADDPRPAAGTQLQTTPIGREDELERRIRALLATAIADLSRVDARRLSPDVQTQYDTARGFVRQAEDALRARNLVFAETNANKAAVLAAQLAKR
jgi:hypothetical protein